jgi:hypothetical protein
LVPKPHSRRVEAPLHPPQGPCVWHRHVLTLVALLLLSIVVVAQLADAQRSPVRTSEQLIATPGSGVGRLLVLKLIPNIWSVGWVCIFIVIWGVHMGCQVGRALWSPMWLSNFLFKKQFSIEVYTFSMLTKSKESKFSGIDSLAWFPLKDAPKQLRSFHHNSWRKVNGLHVYDGAVRSRRWLNKYHNPKVDRGCKRVQRGVRRAQNHASGSWWTPSVIFIVIWDKNNTRSFQSSKDMVGRSCHQQSAPHYNIIWQISAEKGFCLCKENPNPSLVSSV